MSKPSINTRIATILNITLSQATAAIELIDEGATIPFIARYRKEKTQGLDDSQLRQLDEHLTYLRELDKRRDSILEAVDSQKKLTPQLKQRIELAASKTELEDLYLPYKIKRRTKAQIAIEAGIEPLVERLLNNPHLTPENEAKKYINIEKDFKTPDVVLEGARHILMTQLSEQAELIYSIRNHLWKHGLLIAKRLKKTLTDDEELKAQKYKDYFEYKELINKIPSHRAMALFRGRNEGFLSLTLDVEHDQATLHPCQQLIAKQLNFKHQMRPADDWLQESIRRAWRIKIHTKLDIELKTQLKESADNEAIRVFSANLKDLLLAAPAGAKITIGLDPGFRTGIKIIVIDQTGKVLDQCVLYPHPPQNRWDESIETLQRLIKQHNAQLISIGNGTASRESDQLVAELMKRYPNEQLSKVTVSEAGASVYSASELAANEYPDMDVSLRGAVSIARRLQDPLAELVKIDPKAIGVGQYQHDVNQSKLAKSLEATVEDCVNAVGVDVNTASAALLTHVAGLNTTIANNIVTYRDDQGSFPNRKSLLKVPRLGPKAFEQAAGFLRVLDGTDPIDASAVHPESISVVNRIATTNNIPIKAMIGNTSFLASLNAHDYVSQDFGLPTVSDIIKELEKPGRDPRPEFVAPSFQEGVNELSDLEVGMHLEGVVSNVTNFGAFVDIGVHQDGLVHISKLSDTFIKDPRDVVKSGDLVKVKVDSIDIARRRISLDMRQTKGTSSNQKQAYKKSKRPTQPHTPASNAMADAFQRALK